MIHNCDRNIDKLRESARALKYQRRQFSPRLDGGRVHQAPGLEEFHQLLASRVFVPLAVALDDFQQAIGRRIALPARASTG